MVNPLELTVPEIFPDDSVVRHSMAVNYTNLIKMDERVGKLINKLKKEDLYDDSFIFFYSDHGGPFPRHKRAIYETGTKVPFLVKFPGGKNEKVNKKQAKMRTKTSAYFLYLTKIFGVTNPILVKK